MKCAPYLLKNLLILDRATSEHLCLRKVAGYINAQLLNLDPKISPSVPSIRDLITLYYSFIREKAKCFGLQASELAKPSSREAYMKEQPPSGLLNEINICFKVQNMILNLSQKFKGGNKSTELV